MEPATRETGDPRVFVIPADIGWSDIGSWSAVYELLAKHAGENIFDGPGQALDAGGNYLWSPGKFVAAIGVRDLVVVDTPDAFGAANVDVISPTWLSGGVPVMVGIQLPFNRLFIIGLATVAVAGMYFLLFRTDAGLRVRAVTQNRGMAACLGVRSRRVDALTFALGAGLAGIAGCALTQIGNVGPELGQNYIVDSFMVVVTGGVGKLLGTILAALGIGGLNKIIEPGLGAVFGKVAILVAVILFIQRRPSGLFAAKGRYADS
jgi:urea transport system permease protein